MPNTHTPKPAAAVNRSSDTLVKPSAVTNRKFKLPTSIDQTGKYHKSWRPLRTAHPLISLASMSSPLTNHSGCVLCTYHQLGVQRTVQPVYVVTASASIPEIWLSFRILRKPLRSLAGLFSMGVTGPLSETSMRPHNFVQHVATCDSQSTEW